MNLNICTISFRHQLISFQQIAEWARSHAFQGIELWGVHAKNMQAKQAQANRGNTTELNKDWLQDQGLVVPMISDYLPLVGDRAEAAQKAHQLGKLGTHWGAKKIRTFAGDQASHLITPQERSRWVRRLRELCSVIEGYGLYLVVETHPNTLADTLQSTLALIEEINHPALRINFDVIHVWESGDDVKQALHSLEPLIDHIHLKNISDHSLLDVFKPANVYAPAGSRLGMVNLFEGAFDFADFLRYLKTESSLNWNSVDASLEWFGGDVQHVLSQDRSAIVQLAGLDAKATSFGSSQTSSDPFNLDRVAP